MTHQLQTTLPQHDIEAFKQKAEQAGKKPSELVREMIHEYIQNPYKAIEMFKFRLEASMREEQSQPKPFRATVDPADEAKFKEIATRLGLPFDRFFRLAVEDKILH